MNKNLIPEIHFDYNEVILKEGKIEIISSVFVTDDKNNPTWTNSTIKNFLRINTCFILNGIEGGIPNNVAIPSGDRYGIFCIISI